MSQLNTRNALITKLRAATITNITTSTDIGYDNDTFDPTGKEFWLSAYFMPADSESTGKSQLLSDDERGLLQISVYSPVDGYDLDNLTMVDDIKSEFKYGDIATFSTQNVEIQDKSITAGNVEESWFKRIISINYQTFSTK